VTLSNDMPMRDGSRDGQGGCLVCGKATPSTRAKYCGRAHQQRSYRLRHQTPTPDLTLVRKALQRRKALVAHTIYECGGCGERFIGERRCPDCNLYARSVGLGGSCPDCETIILIADLLGAGLSASA
jgi:ribosomal protein L32